MSHSHPRNILYSDMYLLLQVEKTEGSCLNDYYEETRGKRYSGEK